MYKKQIIYSLFLILFLPAQASNKDISSENMEQFLIYEQQLKDNFNGNMMKEEIINNNQISQIPAWVFIVIISVVIVAYISLTYFFNKKYNRQPPTKKNNTIYYTENKSTSEKENLIFYVM